MPLDVDLFAGIWTCNECDGRCPEESMSTRGRGNRGQCRDCRRHYRVGWYGRNAESAKRYSTTWKRANRRAWLDALRRSKYGLRRGQYDAMLADQDGGCAICGAPEPEDKSLHVDHDHDTGQVRSLLCDLCNRGLGYFGDDPARLDAAARYLRRWGR